jgi:uncharacterized protein YidB (DUF937 family)
MALFDSAVEEVKERFGLSTEQAGALLAGLLGLISDPKSGSFSGFIDRFNNVGLGDTARSWVTTGDNTPISNEQLESALGFDTLASIADRARVDRDTATTALAGMIPHVVNELTPDGDIPDDSTLLSKVGGFRADWGGTVSGAAAGETVDRLDAAAGSGKGGIRAADDVIDRVSPTLGSTADGNSVMTWLLPLIILVLLVIVGFWFCGKSTLTTPANSANANVATNANASHN